MSAPDPPSNFWSTLAQATLARQRLVVATIVRDSGSVPRRTGTKMLIHPDGAITGTIGGGFFEQLVIRDALAALQRGASLTRAFSFNPKGTNPDAFGAVCGGRLEIFLEVVMPEDRLLIVGGGHCGRALAQTASLLDFSMVLADDREEFSRPADYAFPHVTSVLHLPADFRGLPAPDEYTYVALVSKGHPTDEAALRRVIASPAAYIGMIGSLKKRDTVFNKLRAEGLDETLLARIHCPIGLDIGAASPAEIAVSILAQIIQVRAQRRTARDASLQALAQNSQTPEAPTVVHDVAP